MFIRVSIMQCDPDQMAKVEKLWLEESLPQATAQKGCVAARGFRSQEVPGQFIMVGEWETVEQADAYLVSPEHEGVVTKYAPYLKGGLQRFVGKLIE